MIVDAGGDDVGATALARFAPALAAGPYAMLYVVNAFRNLTQPPPMRWRCCARIEAKSHLAATAVVGNSTCRPRPLWDISPKVSRMPRQWPRRQALPVACITAPIQAIRQENTGSTALADIPNGYAVEVYVKPPWS